ncbi:hypothetical protein [Gelatiniphilus marinus]|uniref:C2H2-type domain-containing protein n=1 Tax=Gelatiniphilus marinus TaxID=1759464 RepID=A0ABW5JTP5_9FLAO
MHCKMFGHDLHISRDVTHHVKEYACKYCQKEFTTSSSGNLTHLTPKYREINSVLEYIHKKRISKTNRKKLNPDLLVFKH